MTSERNKANQYLGTNLVAKIYRLTEKARKQPHHNTTPFGMLTASHGTLTLHVSGMKIDWVETWDRPRTLGEKKGRMAVKFKTLGLWN